MELSGVPLASRGARRSVGVVLALLLSVSPLEAGGPCDPPGSRSRLQLVDASEARLPLASLDDTSMDAEAWDLDADGDLDLVVAVEFGRNVILINDGSGTFTDESDARIPRPIHDHEDIAIADFDQDGDDDLIFVAEDDRINELYFNDGAGFFTDASDRIPVEGVSNGVVAADLTGDGAPEILIANRGQNVFLLNSGDGFFVDDTDNRLPSDTRTTQDLELGDIDGDLDLDLLVANERENRILINQGNGVFVDESEARLPEIPGGEETREGDLGDADGDGDLDIFFANVDFFLGIPPRNRLLLNNGSGFFFDVSDLALPDEIESTVDGDFVDLDADGRLDLILANTNGGYDVLLNAGNGTFCNATQALFRDAPQGTGFDIEAADFDGNGVLDLYVSDFLAEDHLELGRPRNLGWDLEPLP